MNAKELKKVMDEMNITECKDDAKYGCRYCTESVLLKKIRGGYELINYGKSESEGSKIFCPYKECLYKEELDKYSDYRHYDRIQRSKWARMDFTLL